MQLESIKAVLLGGLDLHMHGNLALREVFDLGPAPQQATKAKPLDKVCSPQ